jgi:hypothetical protein
MPVRIFRFLVGDSAFKHHVKQRKVEISGETARLSSQSIGYFIGRDGMTATISDTRRKHLSDDLVQCAALWMLGKGARPSELLGEEEVLHARLLSAQG